MAAESGMFRAALAPHVAAVTQAEVARRTGIAQPNISRWLAGRGNLRIEQVFAIVRAVGGNPSIDLGLPAPLPRPPSPP